MIENTAEFQIVHDFSKLWFLFAICLVFSTFYTYVIYIQIFEALNIY